MTFEQARDEVMELVTDAWDTPGAVTENIPKFAYDKLESGRSIDDSHVPDIEAPWGVFRVAWGTGGMAGFGDTSKLWTRKGRLIVTIRTKPGDGQVSMDRIIQHLADSVESESTPGGVRFISFNPNSLGGSGDHKKSVVIPFEFDQRK